MACTDCSGSSSKLNTTGSTACWYRMISGWQCSAICPKQKHAASRANLSGSWAAFSTSGSKLSKASRMGSWQPSAKFPKHAQAAFRHLDSPVLRHCAARPKAGVHTYFMGSVLPSLSRVACAIWHGEPLASASESSSSSSSSSSPPPLAAAPPPNVSAGSCSLSARAKCRLPAADSSALAIKCIIASRIAGTNPFFPRSLGLYSLKVPKTLAACPRTPLSKPSALIISSKKATNAGTCLFNMGTGACASSSKTSSTSPTTSSSPEAQRAASTCSMGGTRSAKCSTVSPRLDVSAIKRPVARRAPACTAGSAAPRPAASTGTSEGAISSKWVPIVSARCSRIR
mmetsp:Transcript_74504/g.145564  ORF Transcript_74504/g.145564 Transcript_74504/m.145564 type:complete len:342 (-) Transcript_74504:446-1471(-)